MPTEYWFPTPIYHNMIDNYNEVQKELSLIVDDTIFKKYDDPNWDTNACSFSDGNIGPSLLAKYKPKLFLNELFENVRLFFKDLNSEHMLETHDIVIDESWLARTRKNEYHHKHAHPNSWISGCLYINADREKDRITFYNDRYNRIDLPTENFNAFNSQSWWYSVGTGDIVLFPSYLTHMVEQTVSTETRVSIAVNTFLKGYIGDEYSLTGLHLKEQNSDVEIRTTPRPDGQGGGY